MSIDDKKGALPLVQGEQTNEGTAFDLNKYDELVVVALRATYEAIVLDMKRRGLSSGDAFQELRDLTNVHEYIANEQFLNHYVEVSKQ